MRDKQTSEAGREPGGLLARVRADESGLALVWMTMFLMVLIGFASLAIDIGHGYLISQRAQNAADAAALAGTIYLPSDSATAISTAQSVAAANGFPGSVAVVTAAQQSVKTQLKVTVTEDVKTWFAKAIGFSNMHVSRTATADYDQPVAMGSPANTFGNQPDCTNPCTTAADPTPEFWAMIEGPDTGKVQGDAFSTRYCNSTPADNCVEGSYGNSDYDANGYYYLVHNTSTAGPLKIDVFDAPFVDVGQQCNDGALTTVYNATHDARYQAGSWASTGAPGTSQYCTGDSNFGDNASGSTTPMTTRFTVYAPDGTAWNYLDNPPVTGCDTSVPGYSNASAAYNDTTNGRPKFRKWWTACSITTPQVGDYVVQVRSTAGTGANAFSMRSYISAPSNGSGQSIYGSAKMGMYANSAGTSNTKFYLARVLPGAANRTLKLDFYDIGDAGGSGSLQVLPPADATVNGSALTYFGQSGTSNCRYTAPPQNSTGPPWGTFSNTSATCAVSGISTTSYNGQWVEWQIPIPGGYSCNLSSSFGCWVTIAYSFGSGVHDVTSWTASLDGNPVRIVK